jgi:hypothetical protein
MLKFKLKLKLIYDGQLVGQSVLVPGTHVGPVTIFFSPLEIFFRQLRVSYFVAPSLTRGRICNFLYNCFWYLPEQSLLGRSLAELTVIFCCLIWDCVPSSSLLTTRRDLGGLSCYHAKHCSLTLDYTGNFLTNGMGEFEWLKDDNWKYRFFASLQNGGPNNITSSSGKGQRKKIWVHQETLYLGRKSEIIRFWKFPLIRHGP